jgi:hypothetical protein
MTSEKKSDDKSLSGLAGFVPTAYYDLIARVCPGVAFWVALSFKSPLFGNFGATKDLSGTSLFILLLLAYLSGIVLTGFSWIWDRLCFYLLTRDKVLSEHLGLPHRKKSSFAAQWTLIGRNIDEVAKASPEAGKTLVKGLAEVTLCENLLTGLIVLAILGFASSGKWFYSPTDYPWQFAAAAVALFLSVAFREMMFVGRVKLAHELHCAVGLLELPA